MTDGGLSASDWEFIHQSVAETVGHTGLDVRFERLRRSAPTVVDPFYGEAAPSNGATTETWDTLATLRAWARLYPEKERLLAMGLKENVQVLLFLPTAVIQEWELRTASTFALTSKDRFVLSGMTYNVQEHRVDPLPSGDFGVEDSVGMYISGSTKPY